MDIAYQRYKEKLDGIFEQYPGKKAMAYLLEDGTKIYRTFSELQILLKKWAEILRFYSIDAGDRVAILAPLMPDSITAGLALAYANITAVLLDPSLPVEEINRLMQISDVYGVLTTEKMFPQIADTSIPIFNLDCGKGGPVRFETAAPLAVKRRLDCDKDTISIIFSSGTTTRAKGVMYTYDSVLLSCEKLKFSYGLTPAARYFMVLPYNHISGYISATAFTLAADTICMIENLTPTRLPMGFREFQPHYFGMVPKVYDLMADKIRDAIHQKGFLVESVMNFGLAVSGLLREKCGLKIGRVLFKPIYSKVLGKEITGLAILGTICKPETARLFLAFGLEWANLYATTETNAPITTSGVFDRYPLNSVGKVDRFSDIDVVIHQPDGEGIGEVYVKTPLIMKGYFREPKLTAQAFDGEYFRTGDMGYIDQKGYLFLVGRSKDVLILHSGKKVSAMDIDAFYSQICPEVNLASCGIPGMDGYDTVHLFLETGGQSRETIREAHRLIEEQSGAGSLYQIATVHEIARLPLTAVGKVKRFLLKEALEAWEKEKMTSTPEEALPDGTQNGFLIVRNIIRKITKTEKPIEPGSRLQKDLGLDSMEIFELCVEVEETTGKSMESYLHEDMTAGELGALIDQKGAVPEQGGAAPKQKTGDVEQYPFPKMKKDIRAHKIFMRVSCKLWRIEALGLENIDPGQKYIFCPNHESYCDGLWIVGCLDDQVKQEMCSLAAAHLFDHKVFRRGLAALGGIPVHRGGNPTPAMRRACECLASGKYDLLIHPEGTRTRSGKLGEFKPGAAKLAMETGVTIIPVCINGAYEIYPPHRRLPRLFDWRHLRRYPLQIHFGEAIIPEGKTEEEITGEIRRQIIEMKQIWTL